MPCQNAKKQTDIDRTIQVKGKMMPFMEKDGMKSIQSWTEIYLVCVIGPMNDDGNADDDLNIWLSIKNNGLK